MARIVLAILLVAAAPGLAAPPKPQLPAAAVAPASLTPSVKNGVELWRAGDYAGAVAMWQPFANGGDADAMFNIGQAYKLGRAVPKDAVVARDWYRKAALKGHLPAQANLGILLFQAGEKAEAVRWLKAAADKNEMRAQYVLGVASWNGDSVPRSMTMAYGYLARASAQGLPEATTALNNLTGVISPVERANGWAVATSLAAGNGVPAMFVPGADRQALAAADNFNRDQVIRPLPKLVVPAPATVPPASYSLPAQKPPANEVAAMVAPAISPPVAVASAAVQKPAPTVSAPPKPDSAPPANDRPAAPAVTSVAIPASTPAPPASEVAPKPVEVAATPPKPIAKPIPKPVEVAEAKPQPRIPPKPSGWRIQLGAFSKKAQAEAAWTDVKTKQKQLVGAQKPIYEADGSVTKLQMGPYATKVAARDACAKIAFTGRACFVTEG